MLEVVQKNVNRLLNVSDTPAYDIKVGYDITVG